MPPRKTPAPAPLIRHVADGMHETARNNRRYLGAQTRVMTTSLVRDTAMHAAADLLTRHADGTLDLLAEEARPLRKFVDAQIEVATFHGVTVESVTASEGVRTAVQASLQEFLRAYARTMQRASEDLLKALDRASPPD